MPDTNGHYLDVPGARLYYEIRGTGPTLLLIAAPMGAAAFTAMAETLSDQYTVVTYDPRGISRSTFTAEPPEQDTPQLRADDVHRLLTAVAGDGPAHVFGSSGGALTGLAMVTTHPGRVRSLVAHEPPLVTLLPDRAELAAEAAILRQVNRDTGPSGAMLRFLTIAGAIDPAEAEHIDPDAFITAPQQLADSSYFLERMLPATVGYIPDIAALRDAAPPIIVANGAGSAGQLPHRGAAELAHRLQTTTVEFPGDHAGWLAQPTECAETLRKILLTAECDGATDPH